MGRKVQRVRYTLDPKGIKNLPQHEIAVILRGTDDLIMSGGRSLLAKILKGSKEKKVLGLDLHKSPVYGYYKHLSIEEILARIDWVIVTGYLRIEYDYRLPLLVYTGKGWEIEKDTYSDELLRGFDKLLESGCSLFNMSYLKDRNRELILMLLDKIKATGNGKYLPILKSWEMIDYKKVRERIGKVIAHLKQSKPKN